VSASIASTSDPRNAAEMAGAAVVQVMAASQEKKGSPDVRARSRGGGGDEDPELPSGGLKKTHASARRIPHRERSRHSGPDSMGLCPGQAARDSHDEEMAESWRHGRPRRLRVCFAPVPEHYSCNFSVWPARARDQGRFRGDGALALKPRVLRTKRTGVFP
jgi:hypothetical protein